MEQGKADGFSDAQKHLLASNEARFQNMLADLNGANLMSELIKMRRDFEERVQVLESNQAYLQD